MSQPLLPLQVPIALDRQCELGLAHPNGLPREQPVIVMKAQLSLPGDLELVNPSDQRPQALSGLG
jgi:hypothetical protein